MSFRNDIWPTLIAPFVILILSPIAIAIGARFTPEILSISRWIYYGICIFVIFVVFVIIVVCLALCLVFYTSIFSTLFFIICLLLFVSPLILIHYGTLGILLSFIIEIVVFYVAYQFTYGSWYMPAIASYAEKFIGDLLHKLVEWTDDSPNYAGWIKEKR